jgi:hypothetical protein
MANYGIIRDVEPYYGAVTRIRLGTPRAFDFPERNVFADTRIFLLALEEAFGSDWKDQVIEYEIDGCNLLTWWSPLPEHRLQKERERMT